MKNDVYAPEAQPFYDDMESRSQIMKSYCDNKTEVVESVREYLSLERTYPWTMTINPGRFGEFYVYFVTHDYSVEAVNGLSCTEEQPSI